MDEWHVGDPEDWGDSVGVPDIPYMGYLNGNDGNDDEKPPRPNPTRAPPDMVLSDEAWKLYNDYRSDEAIVLINRAVELNPRYFNHWNRKGIILEDLHRYEESKECYQQSLILKPGNDVVLANMARMMEEWARHEKDAKRALEIITEAISLLPSIKEEMDVASFWRVKGETYYRLNDNVEARRCYLRADNLLDELREFDEKIDYLKTTADTLINIAGTKYYSNTHLVEKGSVVDLIPEPENEHDGDAIRVEINGKTLGYVANSPQTLIDEVKSATDLKDKLKPDQKAEIKFWYMSWALIAKLI